jgi:glycerate kinase
MKKIVVASDSFKGSLTSGEIASIVAEAAGEIFPDCETVCLEMADGGEGTIDALRRTFEGTRIEVTVSDPLGRPVVSEYAVVDIPGEGLTAVIEMSKASGLTLIPAELRNPLHTSTFGTGELILDALGRGCRHFLIGIGGSATNDGGTGMLEALGWRFLDSSGQVLDPVGASLGKVSSVSSEGRDSRLDGCTFVTACDVDNPFCGPDGAACVFAPQKGAGPEDIKVLDDGLCSFASVIRSSTGIDIKDLPGAGAAGGLGGALKAFLGAELVPGAEMVLDAIGFDSLAEGADLVITGEGRMDSQTLKGKAPLCVLRHASKLGIPTVALAGIVSDYPLLKGLGYKDILCINPPGLPLETALQPANARRNLYNTVRDYFGTS